MDEIHAAAGVPANRRDNLDDADKAELEALIPPAYAGATVEARRNAWAEDMARKVRLSYPTQVVARSIERDATDSFKFGAARDKIVQLLLLGIRNRGYLVASRADARSPSARARLA